MARMWFAGAILLLAFVAGCGDSSKGTVSGEVTLDGTPVADGMIRFVPADGKSQTADARITNGKYRAEVPAGDKRVEISAPKVVGKRKMYNTPDSPTVDDIKELLPDRYNAKSDLKFDVKGGAQTKDWPLTSK